MHVLTSIASILSFASFGSMVSAVGAVLLARSLHRDRLANQIAAAVAKVTWALRIGGEAADTRDIRNAN